MKYSFDNWGWYSIVDIPSRQTEIAPPECGERIEGQLYPNFTGFTWIWLEYVEPTPEPTPEPIPEIEPDIVYKNVLTPLEFLNRFTDEELVAILTLTKTNVEMELWWTKYNKAQDMDLDDPQTIAGVQALEAAGLLAEGRAAEILTKYPI